MFERQFETLEIKYESILKCFFIEDRPGLIV